MACIVLMQSLVTNPTGNPIMVKTRLILSALSAVSLGAGLLHAQNPAQPAPRPGPVPVSGNNPSGAFTPGPIDPVIETPAPAAGTTPSTSSVAVPGPSGGPAAPQANQSFDIQGDPIGLVLGSLARQAGINISVSEKVTGPVTMRLDNMTARDAIDVIVNSRGLFMDEQKGVYYIKTAEERSKEPAEGASYTFSYASADKIQPLLDKQLSSGLPSQFDQRTNTIFYRETHTNMDKVRLFLETIDRPTEQVMIEARLVEVTANPQQNYGINWAGVVGGATPQTFRYGGSTIGTQKVTDVQSGTAGGTPSQIVQQDKLPSVV